MSEPNCPICTMPEPLLSVDGFECATCGHEWMADIDEVGEVRDVNGNLLAKPRVAYAMARDGLTFVRPV